jgi:hypothetical protein
MIGAFAFGTRVFPQEANGEGRMMVFFKSAVVVTKTSAQIKSRIPERERRS